MSFGARALIRLGALTHNLKVIRNAAPDTKVMAVVKANAYGHGLEAVAKNLTGVDALAVARVPEAMRLRKSGIKKTFVLLAGVQDLADLETAVTENLQPVVHCEEQIALLQNLENGTLIVWLKFDSGMNRLGFSIADPAALIARVSALRSVREVRLMTHFASADIVDELTTRRQLQRFAAVLEEFDGPVSIANSAGFLGWPRQLKQAYEGEQWIRPGIALFGISPFADKSAAELGLIPVMRFEARLIAIKQVAKGERVGYAGDYECQENMRLGIISAGYGDGYSRHFKSGTPVLLNDRFVAVVGRVSMDMIAVDLGTESTDDSVGDIATLWGDGLPVEDVAPWASAIPYELVCGVMNRETSEYVD